MTAFCMADKKEAKCVFEGFFIKREANDERLYVKKAVNWALRSIGKSNKDLNNKAIECAYELLDKPSKWIAKDAIRELEKDGMNILD